MKLFVVAVSVIAAALAAPNIIDPETSSRRALPALVHEEIHDELGQYTLFYRTAEGTEVNETGRLVPTSDGHAHVLVIDGETKYIGTDGKLYVTKYSAGVNGTKMESRNLPGPIVAETEKTKKS